MMLTSQKKFIKNSIITNCCLQSLIRYKLLYKMFLL